MGAFLYPIDSVLAAARPEEPHADAKQRFVHPEVAADGAAMEDIENEPAESRRDDDEEERVPRLKCLADDKAIVVDAKVVVASELQWLWVSRGSRRASACGVRR